ncbi:MAG: serine kinase [Bacteroidota bacterium]|nr:MAG: serine kinase [Bacteroidota bacterium]
MKLIEVIEKLGWKVISGQDQLHKTISGGYCSDLLSDVMGTAEEGQVWITIQVHKNIVAVAALKELAAILLVKGLKAPEETLDAARSEGIPVLQTNETAFEAAGKLYQLINA